MSPADTIINKRAGWRFAAKAILRTGLPKLELSHASDYATEHMNALGTFAQEIATRLLRFAHCLYEYRQTAEYKRARQFSDAALVKRH